MAKCKSIAKLSLRRVCGSSPRAFVEHVGRLFGYEGVLRPIGWTADGASVVASGGGTWLVSAESGDATRLVNAAVGDGDVTRDGKYVVASVSNTTADAWLIENLNH